MSDLVSEKRTRSSQSKDNGAMSSTLNTSSSKTTPRRDFFTSSNGQKRSPVSPTRITRLQEKEEMQSLNDRLIIYIETVRNLEAENFRLKNEMTSFNEVSTRDVSEIKVLYERELQDAKRLIDELAREKAKFEIDLNKHKANAQDALVKMERFENEAKESQKAYIRVESELSEYKSRCDSMTGDLKRKTDELNQMRPQCSDLEKHLAKLRQHLEEETLARVDLENKNSTLKEDLNFKSQLYEKETDQLRFSKRSEIEQVDNRLRDEYDSKLMNELNQIRNEAENKIKEMKDEVERRYQNKFQDAETSVKRSQHTVDALRDEVSGCRSKITEYESDIKNLNQKITLNDGRVADLEEKLKRHSDKYEKDLTEKDAEIDKSRSELNTLLIDYQELYDIKIALDMEIEAYRKILEAEETRLNITNHSQLCTSYLGDSLNGTCTKKSKKRKVDGVEVTSESSVTSLSNSTPVYQQSAESSIGLEITEFDFDAKSMCLQNKSDKDLTVGGWIVKQVADANETDYKIPKSRVIKAGESLTIWSSTASDSKQPEDLVLTGNKQWLTGSNIITILSDKDGNEKSRRECQKILVDKKSTFTSKSVKESKSTFGKLFSWGK
jgi:lamin B